jgi:thiol-disulfide isomerase/thioredoxin
MQYFIPALILLFSNSFTSAQIVNIQVNNLNEEKIVLYSLSGETQVIVDSIISDTKGIFHFDLNQNHAGFYRLAFDNKIKIDFIYDNADVELVTDANNIFDSLKVIKSESNKIYYEFVKLNKDYKTKTELLQIILANYPQADDYYLHTKEKFSELQEEYRYFVNVTSQFIPSSFIARYIRSSQLPVVDAEILFDDQLFYFKTHSLGNVNFYDDGLIYSDAFTNKTIEYLSYYRNSQLPQELLEKEFIIAVDTILNKAKVNEKVYTHLTEYLLVGFKNFGFENVVSYIVENYVIKDELCLNQKLTTSLERRIQQSKLFKVGSTVPNIILPDTSGKAIELTDIKSEQLLILFYASWCPHCQTLIPEIYRLYKKQPEKKVEVLAVSIDTSRIDWMNFIRTYKLDWLNVSDLNGWNGSAASDYFLYATPTIFPVDKERKVLLSSPSLEELIVWFE